MPKLILRCNYLKNAPPSHLENFVTYIGTRDGVEKVESTIANLPPTARQEDLIQDILRKIPDAGRMHEYYDYLQRPTRENASEFITQALENNLDIIAKKKNYMDYLANRLGVEKTGTHGLFSNEGESIVLFRVADEVANHTGVVWTNVISLRREDAERLGYDSAAQWQALLRSRVELLCENYKIDSRNLKWYAAFHNESHHPHVHLVVYSTKPSEGYLTKKGIETMRSAYAHDIFRQEFMSIYEKKTKQREALKEQADKSLLFLLRQMQQGVCHNETIARQMKLLSERLSRTGGKKVYGYLKADVKAVVNGIVDELAGEEPVAACYRAWLESKNEILHYYKDTVPEPPPLSEQKELKSIKNMVIREAVRFGQGYFYAEEEGLPEQEEVLEESAADTDWRETDADSGKDRYGVPEVFSDDLPTDNMGRRAWGESDTRDGEQNAMGYYADWTDTYQEARGYLYGTPETEPDAEAAYEIMGEEAEKGNAYAMHDMGKIYAQGIFVEPNQEAAEAWYHKSLTAMLAVEQEKENTYLEYRIGKMYQYGLGTEENLAEAAEWFLLAAQKEHKFALYSLGMFYLHGKGVEQDEAEAFRLFLRSYRKGNLYAAYELGKLYEAGRGTERNQEKADSCYRAAFLGFLNLEKKAKDDTLWYRIGSMYLHGIGTEADEVQAEKYLTMAADYGNPHAAYQLAKLYIRQETDRLRREPEEIPDYEKIKKAAAWLRKAAEQGNPSADYALGKLYGDGILTARDMDRAFFHLQRAAAAGNVYLRQEDVLHIPGLGFDGLVGYSPIAMAKNAVGMTLACEEYGAGFFENGATPGGVLEHPGVLKDPAKVRESWHAVYGGSKNAGKVAVLEEGMKYQQIGIPPEEAQFLETRKFQVDEIARLYRIPPHMVGDLDKSSFSNIEQQSLEFVKYTLDPWVVRWEQSLQKALLLPREKREYFVKLNVDGLLRGDYQSRMTGYSVGRQNGWLSTNDIREMEDMNPIPAEEGGDLYLVNGNLCKLKDAGLFAGKGQTGQKPPEGRQFRQGDSGLGL